MPEGLDGSGRHAWVAQLRVKIECRKWAAAHLQSRAWGERIQLEFEQQISITPARNAAESRVIEGVVL